MKKILFPITSKIHWARNQLLLIKLKEYFDVIFFNYEDRQMRMADIAIDIMPRFKQTLDQIKPDLVLIRADRAELLPCAMLSIYSHYPVAQIEAGDLSGTWDNKIRFAISHLADYHFATNNESAIRLKKLNFKNIYNVGSLDCEYAMYIAQTLDLENILKSSKPYILYLYHNIPGENESIVLAAIEEFRNHYDIIGIRGNNDYGLTSKYREEYTPEQFIRLLKGSSCLVGNSSAGLKEAGILGVPVVNIGRRQANRLRTRNVIDVICAKISISRQIHYQLTQIYEPDYMYYQKDTSEQMVKIIQDILSR